MPENARTFLIWFAEEYPKRRDGADYLVNWARDGKLVQNMLKATSYERLQKLALLLMTADADPFINQSDRGIPILSLKFNWLSARLAAWERSRVETRGGGIDVAR